MTVLPHSTGPYIIWLMGSSLLSMNFLPALGAPATTDFCVDPLTRQAHSCLRVFAFTVSSSGTPVPHGSLSLSLSIHSGLCLNFTSSELPLVILFKIAPCYSLSSFPDLLVFIEFIVTWHYTPWFCLFCLLLHSWCPEQHPTLGKWSINIWWMNEQKANQETKKESSRGNIIYRSHTSLGLLWLPPDFQAQLQSKYICRIASPPHLSLFLTRKRI